MNKHPLSLNLLNFPHPAYRMTLSLLIFSSIFFTDFNLKEKKTFAQDKSSKEVVEIYKFDGTRQCYPNDQPIPFNEMLSELERNNITVLNRKQPERRRKVVGILISRACGDPRGYAHFFKIYRSDLEKAEHLRFKLNRYENF